MICVNILTDYHLWCWCGQKETRTLQTSAAIYRPVWALYTAAGLDLPGWTARRGGALPRHHCSRSRFRSRLSQLSFSDNEKFVGKELESSIMSMPRSKLRKSLVLSVKGCKELLSRRFSKESKGSMFSARIGSSLIGTDPRYSSLGGDTGSDLRLPCSKSRLFLMEKRFLW